MKIRLVRVPNGYAFADAEGAKAASRHRLGDAVLCDVVKPRSVPFQRKFFALLTFAFDYWEPGVDEDGVVPEYRGMPIEKSFDRFRKDVIILCGFHHPVWNAKGELRLEADSIRFDEMEADDFLRLYNTAIGVLMKLVMRSKGFSERALRDAIAEIERFD